ncbi:MAG: CHAT domain-containing protein [Draconibacterium sp.]
MKIRTVILSIIVSVTIIPNILLSNSLNKNLQQAKLYGGNGLIGTFEALDLRSKTEELIENGKPEEAIESYKNYIKDIDYKNLGTLDEIHAYLIIIESIANIYNDKEDYNNAIGYYGIIKSTYEFHEKRISNYENISSNTRRGFSKAENIEDIEETYAFTLSRIGLLLDKGYNYQDAITFYNTTNSDNSKGPIESTDDFLSRKQMEVNTLIRAEMYHTAEHEAKQIVKRMEEEGLTENIYYESFLVDLLTIYQQLNLYDEKWDTVQKLKTINQEDYLVEEATILYFKKEYEKAAVLYAKLCNNTKETAPEYFSYIISYSHSLSLIGQTEKAISLLTDYLTVVRENLEYYVDGVITFLAYLHYENKEYAKAVKYYEEYYNKNINNPALVAAYALPMSICYLKTGDVKKADKFLQDGVENSKKSTLTTLLYFTEENRKDFLEQNSYYADAVFRHLDKRYEENSSISSTVCDYILLTKEIGLNTIRAIRKESVNSDNKEYYALYNKWMDSRNQLFNPNIAINKDSLKDLTRAYEKEILLKLSQTITKNDKFKDISWQNIQEKLKTDEIAIEFVVFNKKDIDPDTQQYGALVITKTCKTPFYIRLCSETELKKVLEIDSDASEKNKIELIYNESVTGLSNLIWKPLEPLLSNISKIYYSPAGLLHSVSFISLTNADNKRLGDIYKLSRLNNTYYIVDKPFDIQFKSIALFGGMDYSIYQGSTTSNKDANRGFNGAFSTLPNTLVEINALDQILSSNNIKTKKYLAGDAVEEKFKEEVLLTDDILHISTHAFYLKPLDEDELFATELYGYGIHKMENNPMNRSGLVFSGANYYWETGKNFQEKEDGIVTANDIANLDLSNVKLVVLSACETGIGENTTSEGVYGMQRAFKLAGVNHLILSLWQVDDVATQEFMEFFYSNLVNSDSIEKAMMQARLKLKEKYPDPYFWGAFEYIR